MNSFLHTFSYPEKNAESKFEKYTYYLILAYILSLFLKSSPSITNIIMFLIVVAAVLAFRKKGWKNDKYIFFGIGAFYFFQGASLLYSNDFSEGLRVMQLRLPILSFVVGSLFIRFSNEVWKKIILFYSLSTLIVSLMGFIYGLSQTIKFNDTGYLYNDNISVLLFGKQAVYFGLYVNIAILGLLYCYKKLLIQASWYKPILITGIVWMYFINFMLASKMAMISLYLVSGWLFIEYVIRNKKYKELGLIMFSVMIGVFLINKMSPKTLNRFIGVFNTEYRYDNPEKENHFNAEYDKEKWNSTNTRAAIWKCGTDLWMKNFWFGVGIGDKKKDLIEEYKANNFIYAINTEKNTHNQYLDIAISNGIVGLLFFLVAFFIFPFYYMFQQKNKLGIAILVCFMICFFTENMFDRYQGVIILPFIFSLIINIDDKTNLLQAE